MDKPMGIENTRQTISARDLTKMALCIAFCAVSALLTFPLPFTPGMVTGLTVALTVTAFVLPPRLAFIAVAGYVFMGAVGLPILPGGLSGLGRILGPTGGFYIGWPFVCFIESRLRGQMPSFRRYALVSILAGIPLTYAGGLISMMLVMHLGFWEGLAMAAMPFIPGDIMKALLGSFIAVRVNKMLASR